MVSTTLPWSCLRILLRKEKSQPTTWNRPTQPTTITLKTKLDYKIPSFIKGVKCAENLLNSLKSNGNKQSVETKFVLNNLRMSVCELG